MLRIDPADAIQRLGAPKWDVRLPSKFVSGHRFSDAVSPTGVESGFSRWIFDSR